MLTNQQMIPNRFKKWHDARTKINWIKFQLQMGRTVLVCTYTKATAYKPKHAQMFKATRDGAFVQSGKKWLCIDYCGIRLQ